MKETERIIKMLRNIFEESAWHGPSVKEVLATVNLSEIHSRINNSHTIIELVDHMIAWRTFVVRRLTGDDEFELTEEQNFPKTTDWFKSIARLEESQSKLINALQQFPEERLFAKVPGREYDYYTLIQGIIQHDIYHTGQIQLIKKAL